MIKNLFDFRTYERDCIVTTPEGSGQDTIIVDRLLGRSIRIVFKRRINSSWRIEINATGYIVGDPEPNFAHLGNVEVIAEAFSGRKLIEFWEAMKEKARVDMAQGTDERIGQITAVLEHCNG